MTAINPVYFLHGSAATPETPADFAFQLFDYRFDAGSKATDNPLNKSGLDAAGPGIYAFGASSPDKITKVKQQYANEYTDDNGAVIAFHLDMTDRHGAPVKLINQYQPDTISVEDWAAAIECFAVKVRANNGYFKDSAPDLAENFKNSWPNMMWLYEDGTQKMSEDGQQAWQALLEKSGISFDQKGCSPDQYRQGRDFLRDFESELELADPMSRMEEEGGAYAIAEYAVENSHNLWDVLNTVYNMVAVIRLSGNQKQSLNHTFQEVLLSELKQSDILKVAAVDNGRFHVVFDTNAIVIDAMQIHRTQRISADDAVRRAMSVISSYPTINEKSAALQAWAMDTTGNPLSGTVLKAITTCDSFERYQEINVALRQDIERELRTEYAHYERYSGAIDAYMTTLKKQAVVPVPAEPMAHLMSQMSSQWVNDAKELQPHDQALHQRLLGAEVTMPSVPAELQDVSLRSPVQLSARCLTRGAHGQPLLRPWDEIAGLHASIAVDVEKIVATLNRDPGRKTLEQLAETVGEKHGDEGLWVLSSFFVATDSSHVFSEGVHCYDMALLSDARARHSSVNHTPLGMTISSKMQLSVLGERTLSRVFSDVLQHQVGVAEPHAEELASRPAPSATKPRMRG